MLFLQAPAPTQPAPTQPSPYTSAPPSVGSSNYTGQMGSPMSTPNGGGGTGQNSINWGAAGVTSDGGRVTSGPTMTSQGNIGVLLPDGTVSNAGMGDPAYAAAWTAKFGGGGGGMGGSMGGMPGATPGSTVSTNGNTTQQMAGPNGPFGPLGPQLGTNAGNILGAGNQVLNTAMDPQLALQKQMQQQNTDQTNVAEAQRGITMSPYGAGVANQSAQNFDINWQNQQLDRQAKGLQAAEGAMGPATSLFNQSYGSQSQGYSTSPPQPQQQQQPQQQRQASAPVQQQQPWQLPTDTFGGQQSSQSPYSQTQTLPNQQPQQQPPQGQGYTGNTNMLTQTGQDYNNYVNPADQPYNVDANGNPTDFPSQFGNQPSLNDIIDPNNTQASDPYATFPDGSVGSSIMNSMNDLFPMEGY